VFRDEDFNDDDLKKFREHYSQKPDLKRMEEPL
jgi:hypothetical protein